MSATNNNHFTPILGKTNSVNHQWFASRPDLVFKERSPAKTIAFVILILAVIISRELTKAEAGANGRAVIKLPPLVWQNEQAFDVHKAVYF